MAYLRGYGDDADLVVPPYQDPTGATVRNQSRFALGVFGTIAIVTLGAVVWTEWDERRYRRRGGRR